MGFAFARGAGLGLPVLEFPCPVMSRPIGGPAKPTSGSPAPSGPWPMPLVHVLAQVFQELMTYAAPVGRSTKMSVTGFLFNCSIVQPPSPFVRTGSELLATEFTVEALTRNCSHGGWGAPASLAGTPIARIGGGIGLGKEAGMMQ